jgi:hypothetical protein
MVMRFKVEAILPETKQGVIIAMKIDSGDFRLTPGSLLNGFPIEPQISAPRATHPDGSPRLDLYAFWLCSRSDLGSFSTGQVIELDTRPSA